MEDVNFIDTSIKLLFLESRHKKYKRIVRKKELADVINFPFEYNYLAVALHNVTYISKTSNDNDFESLAKIEFTFKNNKKIKWLYNSNEEMEEEYNRILNMREK